MLRSAASPGSVGFGRLGSGVSGLLIPSLPAGHLFEWGTGFSTIICERRHGQMPRENGGRRHTGAKLGLRWRGVRFAKAKGAARAPWSVHTASAALLDLGLAKLDVLAHHRIVLLLDELLGLRARVLLRDII